MPFGTFSATEKNARPKPAAPTPRPAAPADSMPQRSTADPRTKRLKLLLVGRNMAIIRDYLCSMERNMADALQAEGLSLYTWDHDTMMSMIQRKKQLEMFFWENREQRVLPAIGDKEIVYHFCISYAGNQQQVLELVIRCIAGDTNVSSQGADAVWLLADGAMYQDPADPFTTNLQSALARLTRSGGVPICLILSQIEALGHYSASDPGKDLPAAVLKRILDTAREAMSGAVEENTRAAMIPVQLYGGLEFQSLDDQGGILLRRFRGGYYQSYLPLRCHTPLIYTLNAISQAMSLPLLPSADGRTLEKALIHHCAAKLGSADWKPAFLGGETK